MTVKKIQMVFTMEEDLDTTTTGASNNNSKEDTRNQWGSRVTSNRTMETSNRIRETSNRTRETFKEISKGSKIRGKEISTFRKTQTNQWGQES